MSNYTKTTDFEAKDSLPTGDSGKIIRGAEFETEFDAISTAIATKADTAGPTFTGTLTFETISDGTIGVTAFVDEDDMSSDSATLVPTQQSVKAYVDSQVTAQDLDFQADSGGALSIDLDSETLTFTGGTGIDTSGSGNAVTFAIDSTVATLTGTQTLTNKTLTSPDVNTPDIDGGTIDGTVIGGTTPAAVSATTVSATGNITVGGTVDGRDVATDGTKLDGIESGATADQTAAEIRTLVESATDSNVFTDADHTKLDGIEAGATGDQTNAEIRAAVEAATDSNVFTDADHSKLDGIEAGADVTDTANVTSAGALMDSEVTNLAQVKAFDSADYATAAQGSTADSALQNVVEDTTPQLGGNLDLNSNDITGTGNIDVTGNVDASLDLLVGGAVAGNAGTRTINVGTAGSVAGGVQIWAGTTQTSFLQFGDDSSISANHYRGYLSYNHSTDTLALGAAGSTKVSVTSTGIDVTGVITTDGMTTSADINFGDNDKAVFGAGSDLQIYHDGSHSYVSDQGAGRLVLNSSGGGVRIEKSPTENMAIFTPDGNCELFYDNSLKLATTSTGIDVTGTAVTDGLTVAGTAQFDNYGGTTGKGRIQFGNSGQQFIEGFDTGNGGSGAYLRFGYGSTETARFDNSGNFGIGTSSPITSLTLGTGTTGVSFQSSLSTFNSGKIAVVKPLEVGSGNGHLVFETYGGGAGGGERMRIDSSGNLLVGTTDAAGSSAPLVSEGGVTVTAPKGVSQEFVSGTTGSASTITITFDGNDSSSTAIVEILMYGYNNKYLDYVAGIYATQVDQVLRNVNDGTTSVALSGSAGSSWTATISTTITNPVVKVKATVGGRASAFSTAPTITFS